MTTNKMLEHLASTYGKQNVLVHTAHHVQVVVGKGKHDIWLSKEGLKWRLFGMHQTCYGAPEKLIAAIAGHDDGKTHVAQMSAAVELAQMIDKASDLFKANQLTSAIFCDAGFKNGRARIGVVMIDGDDVQAIRRNVAANGINEAERLAIDAGKLMAVINGRKGIVIYSDSQSAVNFFAAENVRWISRDKNKAADRVANLRGVDANYAAG